MPLSTELSSSSNPSAVGVREELVRAVSVHCNTETVYSVLPAVRASTHAGWSATERDTRQDKTEKYQINAESASLKAATCQKQNRVNIDIEIHRRSSLSERPFPLHRGLEA